MSSPVRILFVADAGPAVGGGHVMRCLTLAGALAERGAVCGFVATASAQALLETYAPAGVLRFSVPDAEPQALVEAASQIAADWRAEAAVVDHYRIGAEAEAPLGRGRRLLALDDLGRPHRADLVLDSSLTAHAEDYNGTTALIGPSFALVRAEFARVAAAALPARASRPPQRLLVSLGLTDVDGITTRVVAALRDPLGEMTFDVVLGSAAASLGAIEALAARDPRVRLHVDSRRMAGLMAEADLCVGAGGSSTWERCCLGLPTVSVVLAKNQRANALALARAGGAVAVEADAPDFEVRLAAEVQRLRDDPAARMRMIAAASALCDGQGAARVAERLLALV